MSKAQVVTGLIQSAPPDMVDTQLYHTAAGVEAIGDPLKADNDPASSRSTEAKNSVRGPELVVDPTFENWTSDDLDDWDETTCDAAAITGGAEVTASDALGGIHADIVVEAGDTYELVMRHSNDEGDTATYKVYDETGSDDIVAATDLTDSQTEMETVKEFTAPASCVSVSIHLLSKANTDVTQWYKASVRRKT